jgi:hypothetical protein
MAGGFLLAASMTAAGVAGADTLAETATPAALERGL